MAWPAHQAGEEGEVAHLAKGVWAEFIQEACYFLASWVMKGQSGIQGESLWDLKNEVFSCQEDSKTQVRDLGPGQRPLCVVGVRPGVIEGSSRKTSPEMGVGCVRPAQRLDLDLPIPSCQSGFLEPAWGKVISISPKVVLARVIHWVLLWGQQGGSLGHLTCPTEITGF